MKYLIKKLTVQKIGFKMTICDETDKKHCAHLVDYEER